MQELLTKEEKERKKTLKPLTVSEIEKFYLQGASSEIKIGLEYERLSLDKNTLESAQYDKIAKIIEHFASIQNWELIYDLDTVIGAKDSFGTSISLEPGNQFELSLAPKKTISEIRHDAKEILDLLDKIANAYDVIFIGYGITPKTSADNIKILNKRRYKIMNEYLPYCSKGELCPKMMRQSAGIQINVDYKDKKDAYNKLKLFNLIMPFISGLCSNSPIENDKLSNFKSIRNNVWRFTGENRCNLFYKNIFSKKCFKYKNIFKNYINEIFDVPMVFIERDNKIIPIKGKINFKDFMKSGYMGYVANYSDYLNQQSLCFPDVRLKNYIEIRNHDSNSLDFALALCALYKGICLGDIKKLMHELEFLKFDNLDEYFKLSSIKGLDYKIGKIDAWQIVSTVFNFSFENLDSEECKYLKPILDLIQKRKTPSDILIENNIKNAKDLVKFL